MKKLSLLKSIMTVCTSLVLLSCSQDEEVYSCNPEIDSWVKENKAYIQTLKRSQWCNLDSDVSRAAYIAFTQEQKIEFWKEKMEEIKLLDWSEEEFLHIQKAEEYIVNNPQLFRDEKLSEKELDDMETFFIKWMNFGIKNFGWKKQTALAVFATGYKMVDKDGNVELPSRNNGLSAASVMSTASESTCHCNIGSVFSCFMDPMGACEEAECEETVRGCGTLLLDNCDGRCGGI